MTAGPGAGTRPRPAAAALALVASCHPGPTLAVTALSGALAALAGVPGVRLAALVAAVLAGQLGIGWANDALDAERDRSHGRADKPVATGAVSGRTTWRAALVAAAACVPLSLATGLVPGLVHLVAVAGGWAYDLGLKRRPVSALPYAVSFGLLPVFVVLAAGRPVPWWLAPAGALLGVGAHLLNGLPDIDDDAAAGLRPLPVVLGPGRTLGLGAALLVAAALVLALAPADVPTAVRWLAPAAALAAAGAAVLLGRPGRGAPGGRTRAPFALAVAVAGVDVALLGLVLHA